LNLDKRAPVEREERRLAEYVDNGCVVILSTTSR